MNYNACMKYWTSIFPPIIRNVEADTYFENFFIFSILSIVGIRIFLVLTGYPQLGGGELHIAHMLWGGLLMAIALILNMMFLNKALHQLASIIAGIGFGAFIDELGKFITADNNYFFQPTFALIYSVFVLLYVLVHLIKKRVQYTQVEYVANVLEVTKEVLIEDFDREEKQRALTWLAQADPENRFTKTLKTLITSEKPIEIQPSIFSSLRQSFALWYRSIITRAWIQRLAIIFFFFQATGYLVLATLLIVYRATNTFCFKPLDSSPVNWRDRLVK